MYQAILIMIGGGVGSLFRFWLYMGAHAIFGRSFPYGTLSVNVLGSFLVGIISALLIHRFNAQMEHLRVFIIVGFLGGFTTFSSFSIETYNLFEHGEMTKALLNIFISLALCMLAVMCGAIIGKEL